MAKSASQDSKSKSSGSELRSSAVNWCFTADIDFEHDPKTANKREVVEANIHKWLDPISGAFCDYQVERGGETGYLHLQGFIHLKERMRGSAIKKILCEDAGPEKANINMSVARNVPASFFYPQKSTTQVEGPFIIGDQQAYEEFGKWAEAARKRQITQQVRKEEFLRNVADVQEAVESDGYKTVKQFLLDDKFTYFTGQSGNNQRVIQMIIDSHAEEEFGSRIRDVSVDYIYGRAGSGKTWDVYKLYEPKKVFSVSNYDGEFPFDGYEGQPVLLLDEYRSSFKWNFLLQILQGYPLRLNVKGSHIFAQWTKVIIISNIPITEQYQGKLEESRDPLYRRFVNGVYFKKTQQSERLPYASEEDAMVGKTTDGYPTGIPSDMFTGDYSGHWDEVTHNVVADPFDSPADDDTPEAAAETTDASEPDVTDADVFNTDVDNVDGKSATSESELVSDRPREHISKPAIQSIESSPSDLPSDDPFIQSLGDLEGGDSDVSEDDTQIQSASA